MSDEVAKSLVEVCKNIESRYEIFFIEIGADENHVHFLIQSVPMMSVKEIAQTVKSITAKELFRLHPEVKTQLWGGQFWTSGFHIANEIRLLHRCAIETFIIVDSSPSMSLSYPR